MCVVRVPYVTHHLEIHMWIVSEYTECALQAPIYPHIKYGIATQFIRCRRRLHASITARRHTAAAAAPESRVCMRLCDRNEYIHFPQIFIQNTFSIKSAVFLFSSFFANLFFSLYSVLGVLVEVNVNVAADSDEITDQVIERREEEKKTLMRTK